MQRSAERWLSLRRPPYREDHGRRVRRQGRLLPFTRGRVTSGSGRRQLWVLKASSLTRPLRRRIKPARLNREGEAFCGTLTPQHHARLLGVQLSQGQWASPDSGRAFRILCGGPRFRR